MTPAWQAWAWGPLTRFDRQWQLRSPELFPHFWLESFEGCQPPLWLGGVGSLTLVSEADRTRLVTEGTRRRLCIFGYWVDRSWPVSGWIRRMTTVWVLRLTTDLKPTCSRVSKTLTRSDRRFVGYTTVPIRPYRTMCSYGLKMENTWFLGAT